MEIFIVITLWRGIRYLESGCGYKAFDFIFHASVYDRSYLSVLRYSEGVKVYLRENSIGPGRL